MGKSDIQAQINRLKEEVRRLESLKKAFENMNLKILEAISALTTAKESAQKAYQLLGENYQSKTADEVVADLEGEYTNISDVIKTLQSVLAASNAKIKSIGGIVKKRNSEIKDLRDQLDKTTEP